MFDQTQMQNNAAMAGAAPTMGGFNYQGMPQAVQKFNNPLTAEQIKKLQQKGAQFSLGITEEEYLRGVCNHRNLEGTSDTLIYDSLTGEARCTICGYQFKPIEANVSPEEIKEDVERIVDILQTIKLMYIDLPADAAKEYFQIIPLIEKIPQLFDFAAKNMTKHESYNWQYNNRNMGAINMFNNLQSMFAGGGMGMPQATGYNPQPMYQQPQGGFGYPGASTMMSNPMMNQPAGYQPQSQAGYAFTPNPAASTAPVAPTVTAPEPPKAPAETTTVTQNVNA